jgi:hypothetical protein
MESIEQAVLYIQITMGVYVYARIALMHLLRVLTSTEAHLPLMIYIYVISFFLQVFNRSLYWHFGK